MAGKGPAPNERPARHGAGARILLIEARYHAAIGDALVEGALAEIAAAGATCEHITVPGALEIPVALAQAAEAGLIPAAGKRGRFEGCVALGCVIRGETTHYETVCTNANHWLMDVAVRRAIPLGNAILTVETEAQALERALGGRDSKGAAAVRACLALIAIGRAFAELPA